MSREADILRANFARFLAPQYRDDPLKIAHLCDEELDQSGKLLGWVREEARKGGNNAEVEG